MTTPTGTGHEVREVCAWGVAALLCSAVLLREMEDLALSARTRFFGCAYLLHAKCPYHLVLYMQSASYNALRSESNPSHSNIRQSTGSHRASHQRYQDRVSLAVVKRPPPCDLGGPYPGG